MAEESGDGHHEIVVVGAGISGLTCGYFLKDRDVVLLEKKDRVGGRTVSGIYGNFAYAKGTEYIGKPDEPLSQLIKRLRLELREIPYPMDGYYDGANFHYGRDINRYLIAQSGEAAYRSYVTGILDAYERYEEIPDLRYTAEERALDSQTARKWLQSIGVPQAALGKFNVASRGLFGASLDDISALSFIPEAAFDFDRDDLDLSEDEEPDAGTGAYSFTRGLTELTDRLSEELADKIRLNCNVIQVSGKAGAYAIAYKDANGVTRTMTAEKVVLAVPAPVALQIASGALSGERRALLKEIPFASYVTVALFSDTPIFDKAFDLAVPDDYFFSDIYDGTWVERHYGAKQAQKKYIACVYIAPRTYKDHSLDTMSDDEILKRVWRDLDRVLPASSKKVTGYDIERFPHAYPVMTPGAYDRLLKLNALNGGSLVLAGDYLQYPTFEAAVQTGYDAAIRILEDE